MKLLKRNRQIMHYSKLKILSPILFAVLAFSTTACEKTEKCTFCDVENPLTELAWLKTTVAEMAKSDEHCSVAKCTYQIDKQGFLLSPCDNCPDNMVSLMDCSGNLLCNIGGYAGFQDTIYNINNESVEVIFKNY